MPTGTYLPKCYRKDETAILINVLASSVLGLFSNFTRPEVRRNRSQDLGVRGPRIRIKTRHKMCVVAIDAR